jgi:hypothetical protein
LWHREGAVTGVQQQVIQARVTAIDMVVEIAVVADPRRLRQMAHDPARNVQPLGRGAVGRGQAMQRVLHHVDAGAAVWRIDHQADPTAGRKHRGQRGQSGRRIGQMVQHAAAIDVVERPQGRTGQVEQGSLLPGDVGQAAGLRTCLGDPQGGRGTVEPRDRARPFLRRHLLCQHQGAVAGAATGEQRVQGPVCGTGGAEDPVVDLLQMAGASDDQAFSFVARVAAGIGKRLVLGGKLSVGCV